MAIVEGRHVGKLRAVRPDYYAEISPMSKVVRVDDRNNIDFWLEVTLSNEDIMSLARQLSRETILQLYKAKPIPIGD